jgi:cell division protein FtsI (penicillin-binding protein 3)
MAYGYGVSLTPIQTLAFYNAIANDGELLKPIFVNKNSSRETKNNSNSKIVLNPSICSKETLNKVKLMMESVVNSEGGTAHNIKSNKFKIAGKTGTCQVDYNTDNVQYISSFVGYFPSESPKYSCIVVIHKPNKNKGYYGSTVAAPVFKKIAEKLHSQTPEIESELSWKDFSKKRTKKNKSQIDKNSIKFKDLVGKNLHEVLPILENLGFKVDFRGKGMIIKKFNIVKKLNYKKIILQLS